MRFFDKFFDVIIDDPFLSLIILPLRAFFYVLMCKKYEPYFGK